MFLRKDTIRSINLNQFLTRASRRAFVPSPCEKQPPLPANPTPYTTRPGDYTYQRKHTTLSPVIMPTTFHGFSRLPAELRLKIWELAVRPSGCGAHFFTITRDKSLRGGDQGTAYNICPKAQALIAAPAFENERSWVKNNPSTYLVDAGLWTSCRDSRVVMEKHFNTAFWRKKRQSLRRINPNRLRDYLDLYRDEDAPGLGCFRQGSEDWTFAVFPHRDLFCLRGSNAQDFCYSRWLMAQASFCSFSLGFDDFRNIAFEFDETWAFDPKVDSVEDLVIREDQRGIFLRTLDDIVKCGRKTRLFLIDYGLRLKPGFSGWQKFHGEGCTFVRHCEAEVDQQDSTGCDAWYFLYLIEEWGEDYWTRWKEMETCRGSEYSVIMASAHVGVLVCERD